MLQYRDWYIMSVQLRFKVMELKFFKLTRLPITLGLLLCSSMSCWGTRDAGNGKVYEDHADVQVVIESYSKGKMLTSVIIDVETGWHIYAKDPGDVGMPTKFWFEGDKVKNMRVKWPKFSKTSIQLGKKEFKSNVYKGTTRFPISFKITDETAQQLQLYVSYAVCGEMCIPVNRVLTIEIPQNGNYSSDIKATG